MTSGYKKRPCSECGTPCHAKKTGVCKSCFKKGNHHQLSRTYQRRKKNVYQRTSERVSVIDE